MDFGQMIFGEMQFGLQEVHSETISIGRRFGSSGASGSLDRT